MLSDDSAVCYAGYFEADFPVESSFTAIRLSVQFEKRFEVTG